ncbi:MarR family winged helix-turn-helix transcriptional regulator [Streptosporangium algeriense]|uniref:MarR family winged helix-turn-helix transcriptional regulator n=1 Tax=Streptosporangium algeriense TaxID=1682748 RepID=A0ABW3DRJ0_9ACTN
MSGAHTLRQTEEAVSGKLQGLELDFRAMTAISNLYRVASSIRNHFEQTVLKEADLTWTAFVVLWVVWIWESIENRHVAAEAGITKGTLTGVAQTLEARGLIVRDIPATDRRRTVFSLTPEGRKLMTTLFPEFNREEQFVLSGLGEQRLTELGESLRHVLQHLEKEGPDRRASRNA